MWVVRFSDKQLEVVRAVLRSEEHRGPALEGALEALDLARWDEPPVRDESQLYDNIDVLVAVAGAHDVLPAQVAHTWLLRKPVVTSVVGAAPTNLPTTRASQPLPSLSERLGPPGPARLDAPIRSSHSRDADRAPRDPVRP